MRSLSEERIGSKDDFASQIWEDVVYSMSQYTCDSIFSKFLPPEEILIHIRPIAAAFATLHFTPLPPMKKIYKSNLYALFYFAIICGIQMYVKQRSITKRYAPYTVQTNGAIIREAKNSVMRQLTEGIKVLPPINQTMDIFLTNIIKPKRLQRLPLKNAEFDRAKFAKFMPITLLWGYLFAREIIIDR